VDPIQSVKGKVVIDAFRLINQQMAIFGQPSRQTTSNLGHLRKPSIQALIHNLNRHYYSINIDYRKNELETKMLLNLHKKLWTHGLRVTEPHQHAKNNEKIVQDMLKFTKDYNKQLEEEETKTAEELIVARAGVRDAKKHLESSVELLMNDNITQCLGMMIDTVVF